MLHFCILRKGKLKHGSFKTQVFVCAFDYETSRRLMSHFVTSNQGPFTCPRAVRLVEMA